MSGLVDVLLKCFLSSLTFNSAKWSSISAEMSLNTSKETLANAASFGRLSFEPLRG